MTIQFPGDYWKKLYRLRYDVVAVPNGLAAAEQLCKQDGPRLALLDWEMPELDGPGVCREVREKKDQGYVYMILLTTSSATKYYRKPPGAFSYPCALMITSGDTAVKSS
jgi:CheY-like chemotaxis protein